jgi:uncharacterized membrane protein YbaN (DUF454 family)
LPLALGDVINTDVFHNVASVVEDVCRTHSRSPLFESETLPFVATRTEHSLRPPATSTSTLEVPPVPTLTLFSEATRGIATVVAAAYIVPLPSPGGGPLPFVQVSLKALALSRLCDASSDDAEEPFSSGLMDNPLQIRFYGGGIPLAARFVAGTVIGNILLCGVFAAIGVAVAACCRHRRPSSSNSAPHQSDAPQSLARQLWVSLPHAATALAYPYSVLMQPIVAASVALITLPGVDDQATGGGGGVVLGVVGVVVAVLSPLHWFLVVHLNWFATSSMSGTSPVYFARRHEKLRTLWRDKHQWQAMSLREQALLMLHGLMTCPHSYTRWEVDRRHTSPHSTDRYRRPATVEAYLGLMEAYRPGCQWYFVVDALYGVGCGAVFGAAWAANVILDAEDSRDQSTRGSCKWVLWVMLVVTLLMIAVLFLLRPFLAYYDHACVGISAVLTAGALALQLAGRDDAAGAILVAQLALGLLMPVVQALRLVVLGSYLVFNEVTTAAREAFGAGLARAGMLGDRLSPQIAKHYGLNPHADRIKAIRETAERLPMVRTSVERRLARLIEAICRTATE